MEENVQILKNSQVTITFLVKPDVKKQYTEKALTKLNKSVKLKGFRSGHIPEEVLKTHVSDDAIQAEMLELMIPDLYLNLVKKHNIRPIDAPKVEITEKEPLTIKLTVDVFPEVKIKNVDKIKVKSEKIEITQKEIDDYLDLIKQQSATYNIVDRAAKEGDRVEIDFEGKIDGKVFEGGASKHHPIIIGSKMFIPGFEEQLIGRKAKDKKDIEVTFPKDYHAEQFKGKKAVFSVYVHNVDEVVMPELNDEFAQSVTGNEKQTIKGLLEEVKEALHHKKQQEADKAYEEKVMDKLHDCIEVELPPSLINEEIGFMWDNFAQRLEMQGYNVEQYLQTQKKTKEDILSEWEPSAKKRVALRLGLHKLSDEYNIEVSEEEISNALVNVKENERQQKRNLIQWQLMLDKTLEYILNNAKK